MLLKRYPAAERMLSQCIELCKGEYITDEQLAARGKQHVEAEQQFGPSAQEIKKNALRRPTNRTIEDRTALEGEYQKFAKENSSFFEYTLLAKSHKKFLRRKAEILDDAKYALAKVTAIMSTQKTQESLEKGKEKVDNIDSEIEKLQKELDKIEK
jgi:hypothetical protein